MKHPAASSGVSGYQRPREGTPKQAGNLPAMIKYVSEVNWKKFLKMFEAKAMRPSYAVRLVVIPSF
jgi:hypothetical protein